MSPKQQHAHIHTEYDYPLYSHDYESAGKTRLSFAGALAIFSHAETPPLKHALEQTHTHTHTQTANEPPVLL